MKRIKTKIIATLGPASSSETVLKNMMKAGLDIVRLNFSHSSCSQHLKKIKLIKTINKKYKRRLRILQDLEGPRIRCLPFPGQKTLSLKKRQGLRVWNAEKSSGGEKDLRIDYLGDFQGMEKSEFLFIADGSIILKIKERKKNYLKTEVVIGGELKGKKGVNIPDARLEFPLLSDQDKRHIDFGVENQVDWIAQSFVRKAKDILEVKKRIGSKHSAIKVIAKIENREGIQNLDSILEVADGILIARGDMGVCLPIWEVPFVQKKIIRACQEKNKIVITATQMLESMIEHIRPTRAEVTDVTNAILDGTNCVMLSGETAIGKYPAETVWLMNQICKFTEKKKVLFPS